MTNWKYVYNSIKPNSVVVRTNDEGKCESISCDSKEFLDWVEEGGIPDPADPPPPPPVVYVYKNSITDQIEDELLFAGLSAMTARQRYDWDNAVKVRRDDPAVLAFLTSLGLDAAEIMSKAEVCP